MASISRQANGRRTIQFVGADGRRRSLRLGKVSQRDADAIKTKVEAILSARLSGQALDAETSRWLGIVDPVIQDRMAQVGLISAITTRAKATVGPFLKEYVNRRIDVKPATKEVWSQVTRNLCEHFGEARSLATITEGDAEEFKLFLIKSGLASTTVHKRLQFARMFFRAAMKHKLIPANPFAEVTAKAVLQQDRQRFVTREEITKLFEVCDPTWRTIVALGRFGGLRCPSEVLSLRWQDVDWNLGRIVVQSPKTEHHPGKATRTIPLFPELRPILEEAFVLASDGAEYVVGGAYRQKANTNGGWRNCNLRTQLERLLKRAGLKPWPRLFHALRASRETELAKDFPIHVVTSWLGNTPRIALKHYLQVTDADFEQANSCGADSGAPAVQNTVQQPAVKHRDVSRDAEATDCHHRRYANFLGTLRVAARASNGEDRIRTCGPA